MANPTNQSKQPTSGTATFTETKPTIPVRAPVATASVSEPTVINVNEQPKTAAVNEAVNYNALTANEKRDYLNVLEEKSKRDFLSVEEQKILDGSKDGKTGGNDSVANVENTDGDENNDPDPEKDGPFKEKDIIKYMYEDWLLKGANWTWCKSASKFDKAYFWTMREINEKRRQRQIESGKTYETETAYDQIAERAQAGGQTTAEKIVKHREAQLKNLELLKAGKFDEAKVSDVTKVMFQNMDEKERKQFCTMAEFGLNNFYSNLAIADQFASNYAQAGMTADLVQNKDFYNNNKKDLKTEFEAQKKHALTAYARLMDQEAARGGDPAALSEKLLNMSKKAVESAEKTIEKRAFNEADKTLRPDLIEKVTKISDTLKPAATLAPGQRRGFFEAAVLDQDFDKSAGQRMEKVNRATLANLGNLQGNDAIRRVLLDLKNRLGINTADQHLGQAYQRSIDKQERNQHMADTLSGISSLGTQR